MSLLDLFVRPRRFFRERPGAFALGPVLAALLVAVVVLTVAYLAIGRLFAAELTATTTVDNPNRPPDWHCANLPDDSPVTDRCDEPETLERREGALLWEAWTGLVFAIPVGVGFGWLCYGVGLHLTSALFGGRGPITRTFAVAAWGLLPVALGVALAAVALALVLPAAAIPPDLEGLVDWLQTPTVSTATLAFGVALSLWQGAVWYGGLTEARDLEPPSAALAAGAVVLVDVLWRLVL
ncbi:YIP1 family protein [Natronobiforma cellulositropha]|uniref:YIP1 family protein n=1 Tax=Natronobiforma cellulositropha TaxID=1679076 RepID=UPI0021D6023C|nr:YIP1 family protein [Natronobiforma cellulositropha]